ncbi:MAG TPA: hypothetical protein PK691_10480 [Thermomicrobiales bacterium]|nr:hypothetical protein [Thermomicrobiales bacterium]
MPHDVSIRETKPIDSKVYAQVEVTNDAWSREYGGTLLEYIADAANRAGMTVSAFLKETIRYKRSVKSKSD